MNKEKEFSNKIIGFGDKIKKIRLEENLSYEQVLNKTKISKSFIDALENENITQLPAYTYSRGLLQNLLEVYGIETQIRQSLLKEFSLLYHNSISSHSPFSYDIHNNQSNKEQLLLESHYGDQSSLPGRQEEKKVENEDKLLKSISSGIIKRLPGDIGGLDSQEKQLQQKITSSIWWVILVVSFILLGIIIFSFNDIKGQFDIAGRGGGVPENDKEKTKGSRRIYSLYSRFSTFDLADNDIVKIFFNNRIYSFHMNGIDNTFDNKIAVNFDLNNEQLVRIYLFEETRMDIDLDGQDDLLIKFQKISGEIAIIFFSLLNEGVKNVNYESIWNYQEKVIISKGEIILLRDQNKTAIQTYIKATTLPVHLTYNIDGQRQNIVNLLPGNTVELLAHDHLELQIGNFRSVNFIVNYMPVKLEVENQSHSSIAKIIKWLPSFRNENKYDLIIKDYIE